MECLNCLYPKLSSSDLIMLASFFRILLMELLESIKSFLKRSHILLANQAASVSEDVNFIPFKPVAPSTTTKELSENKEEIFALTGPLGNPNEICKNPDNYQNKRIVYVAGGVGIAPVYPQVKYLKEKGFNIDVIYGARSKDLLIIKEKIEKVASKVYYTTDDGTYGEKGFVTDVLKKHINEYDICVAIGPVIMMKNVSELTKKYNLKTIVSMNPIMVDGTGMCGACRCEVEGKPKFACIDGPEFDGHKIDFDIALKRLNIYKEEEEKLKNRGEKKSD